MGCEKTNKKIQEKAEQSNINNHDKEQFENMVLEGLRCGGLHTVASKGHGKTRFLFSIADYIRNLDNSRVIAFDGSDSWLYGFSQIPTFNVCNQDISIKQTKNVLENESYSLNNWQLVKTALSNHQDLLFRFKTKKPSKRGFFVRTVINYLDDLQRAEIESSLTHEPKNTIAYFLEESQDCFNSRSTQRTDSEEFLTTFNEARNNKESFFTASQRLNDFSKTIRTKQTYVIGKLNSEDISPQIRRIEKLNNIDLTILPLRTWFYDGKTFVSPTWIQNKKPYIINAQLRQEYSKPTNYSYKNVPASEKKSLFRKIIDALTTTTTSTEIKDDNSEFNSKNDNSEYDGAMSLNEDEILFPSES